MTRGPRTVYRACNLCEAICGLEIQVDADDEIVSIRGDKNDPLSRGHICPKAVALQDIHKDPDRLRHPVRKMPDGSFERISWDEAFDLVAANVHRLQAAHGRDCMAAYLGNPNVHNYGSLLFGPAMLRSLRTRHRYTATSVDQLPHHLAGYLMFGHMLLMPIPDIDHTDFLLILGGNPAVSNGSLMTAPDVKKRIKAIRGRGGRVVVIDPRRSETAALADEHHFIKPGTDALLLAALLNTIFEQGLDDLGKLAEFTDGVSELRSAVADFSADKVAPIIGIDAEAIRALAKDFAAAPSAVCHGRMGVSVQEFGSTCQWWVNALNIITGNCDRPGGAMFPLPAVDVVAAKRSPGSYGRWRSKVRDLPEFSGELPVSTMAEDMLADGDDDDGIRGLITSAGNPVLSTPNGRQLEKAIEGLDFMVSIDIYINETTRHADVILPPTAALEHEHYDLAFHALAIRNTTRYSPAVFEPAADTRHDWQIMLELERRLAPKVPLKFRLQRWFSGLLGPKGMLDLGLRFGPYGKGLWPLKRGLSLKRLKQEPHGIDLGPLASVLPKRLRTADRRVVLAPELLLADVERLRERLATEPADDSLVMISRRHVRSCNSWMHNYPRLMRGKDRYTLLIHPQDATARHLTDGQRATIASRVGEIEAPIEISDEMMPGVVCLPHGWGHDRPGTQLEVANAHPGSSINDLTDDQLIDPVTGNAALSGLPVTVVPVEQAAPKQTAPKQTVPKQTGRAAAVAGG